MDLIKKSIEVIKGSQLENGGLLATPKKGAYPYIYPRDAVIMTKALNRVGLVKNSEKFYYFINKIAKIDNYKEVFHRYNINGWPCVTRKDQNDNEGLILHGIYDTYLHNKKHIFLEDTWLLVKQIVELIKDYSSTGLVRTKRSIHEFYRLENGYDIWVNCACCRGLYDAAEIAKIMHREKQAIEWKKQAEKLEKNIKKRFFDKKLGVFMKNPRLKGIPDISQIAPFYFDIEDSKQLLKKTLKYLKKNLWYKEIGGFRRFRQFEIVEDWHWYTGGSGSWCVFTAFMARFYKKIDDRESYNECLNWLKKVASRTNGLLPEHISTRDEYEFWKAHEIEFNQRTIDGTKKAEELAKKFKGEDKRKLIYWAAPLGWSHAEYILLYKQ
ncbi:hypothetical protein KJ786_01200 [Patescibacteria group bacterium]|nr:hypothetical protein [Patescibacteria group bacterium]